MMIDSWATWYCPALGLDRRNPIEININDVPPSKCQKKMEHAIAEAIKC